MTPPAPTPHVTPVADYSATGEIAQLQAALAEAHAETERLRAEHPSVELVGVIKRSAGTVKAIVVAAAAMVVATIAVVAFLEGRTDSVVRSAIASQETRGMVAEIAHAETTGYASAATVAEHDADIAYLRAELPRVESKLDEILERLPRRAP